MHIEISVNLLLVRNMNFLFFVLNLPVNQKLSSSMSPEQLGLHLHSVVDISLLNEFFSFNILPIERFCCALSSQHSLGFHFSLVPEAGHFLVTVLKIIYSFLEFLFLLLNSDFLTCSYTKFLSLTYFIFLSSDLTTLLSTSFLFF